MNNSPRHDNLPILVNVLRLNPSVRPCRSGLPVVAKVVAFALAVCLSTATVAQQSDVTVVSVNMPRDTPVPKVEVPLGPANSWPLAVPDDPYTADAILDLRGLNEPVSGQSGFIRLSQDKNDFVRGDGESIRFWIVGSDGYTFSPNDMDRHARWLAKLGVNMVRLHVTVCDKREGSQIHSVNKELIDGIHRFIKAAKDNGIYVLISPFYAHFAAPMSWGLPGGKVRMEGLLFLEPKLQDAYREWTRVFYTQSNPYTGKAIANDPTVAILQIHNEDSLLFWTAQALSDHYRGVLAQHFSAWLRVKYGSIDQALKQWDTSWRDPLDAPDNGVLACLQVYELTIGGEDKLTKRRNDTAEFLAKFQRDFYAEMGRYLREDLGCQQLLNATNWRTANDARLKALERYSYHALDIDSENEYVGSDYQHQGENGNYRIDPGHYLVNESVLSKPFEMCTNFKQEIGHPFVVTETAWKNPNRYQSEGPFLAAAYQSLTGIDGVAWFSCQTPGYETDPLREYWKTQGQLCTHKWNHCYPAMMAGFPANALLFRRGDLRQAEPVVVDARSFDEIFSRQPARISDDEAYGDQRNRPELLPGWTGRDEQINRAAFLIGPVTTRTGGDASASQVADLSQWLDPEAGTIRSSTGQLYWDYHRQLCTMDSPKSQGVTGFLKSNGARFELTDVVIESENDYATVNVTSLDDQPLAISTKVLMQVVTVNRLSGFSTKSAKFDVGKGKNVYSVEGEQIVQIGKPPFRIANTKVAVTLRNSELKVAQVLDINGYLVEQVPIVDGRFDFPNDAIYVVCTIDSDRYIPKNSR